ncbi:MAG: ketose-bisphosphate aldolase [Clostridia bacterium]|nr:ketose-bisphosphate aldolase [Clostridia bacterium]
MSLANMKELLLEARRQQRAVGAFSVSSVDMICGVVRAAEALDTPVILQVAQVRLPHSPLQVFGPVMLAAARAARVPVAVHLDHGTTEECIREALEAGFTSVMFDGSRLPMAENIVRTQSLVRLAERYGAAVEAEIGVVGKTEAGAALTAQCADPEDAVRFVRETGVDALAVAIGNAHGVYEGTPELRFDVLERMQGRCGDTAFVLHGGTGISDADFRRAISLGMHKINIATASFMAVHQAAQGAKDYFDMVGRMSAAAEAVARQHIGIFGIRKEASL